MSEVFDHREALHAIKARIALKRKETPLPAKLSWLDAKRMADEVIRKKGYEPGLHEDWGDDLARRFIKQHEKANPPKETGDWADKVAEKIFDKCVDRGDGQLFASNKQLAAIIRKHQPKPNPDWIIDCACEIYDKSQAAGPWDHTIAEEIIKKHAKNQFLP